jgi:sugar phosphate isomerase/epimerase
VDISICSFSFHRLLQAGQQDIFKYISDCKDLGCTYLDPWSGHFEAPGREPGQVPDINNPQHKAYLTRIQQAAQAVGLPFGCIAVDGAHIYEDDPATRQANRQRASQWLEVAAYLGAKQIRIDSGYHGEAWPDEVFAIIVEGYKDLIAEAQSKNVEVIIENHWGPSQHPEQLLRLLEAVPSLGLLFDSHNWAEGKQQQGWQLCAKYAKAMHLKTFAFDESGQETTVDVAKVIALLQQANYHGVWGIESVPENGDELGAAAQTIALIKGFVA